jgi:hypothetical protein
MPPTQGMPPILIKAPHLLTPARQDPRLESRVRHRICLRENNRNLEAGTSKVDNDLSLGHIPTVLPLTMEAASRLMSLQRMVLL